MPKGSIERTNARKAEIMNACCALYRTMSFKDITIKEIANYTSFTRPSIYNYFQTKEEIFLALFAQEFAAWNEDLQTICNTNDRLTRPQLADLIASSLQNRELMLKILSVNLYDMEANSRFSLLVSFKKTYRETLQSFKRILETFCAEPNGERTEEITLAFFAYLHGVYPFAYATDYQARAMQQAGMRLERHTIYDMVKLFFINIFNQA